MKNFIALLPTLIVAYGITHAQFNWVNTGGPDGSLQSSILSNENYAFVPEYDYLYRTADGVNWEAIQHNVYGRLAIHNDTLANFLFDQDPVSGHIQFSFDNGSTWIVKEIPNELDDPSADMVLCSHGLYVYIISSNLLYHSTDLGDSWMLLPHQGISGNSLFEIEDRIYISSARFLARTDTSGNNWDVITPPLSSSDYISNVVSTGPYIFVHNHRPGIDQLFYSHNDADSWEMQPMEGRGEGDNIQLVGNKLFAFSNQYFLASENFGESWDTLQHVDYGFAPYQFTGLKDKFLFTTFDCGVFQWDDSTQSIQESHFGLTKGYIYDLCSSGDHIWASTGNGIHVFNRQSKTWIHTASLPDPDLRYNFISVNEDGLLVLSDYMQSNFYTSEDGGYSWKIKSIPSQFLGVFWIEMVGDYIYVLTDFPVVIRSSDKGQTWEYLLDEQGDYIVSGITKFKDKYYMAGSISLYNSPDYGESWQPNDVPFEILSLGAYADELFAVTRNSGQTGLYISPDGITWRDASEGFPQNYPIDLFHKNKPLFYRDAENYYVFNADLFYYQIYTSPIENISWKLLPFTIPLRAGEHPYDCIFENDLIYLGGQGMYTTEVENPFITSTENVTQEPQSLFTISPNPAKELLTITPNATKHFGGTISLYSINGSMMISKPLDTSEKTIAILIDYLPSGLYYIMFQTENGRDVKSFVKQ